MPLPTNAQAQSDGQTPAAPRPLQYLIQRMQQWRSLRAQPRPQPAIDLVAATPLPAGALLPAEPRETISLDRLAAYARLVAAQQQIALYPESGRALRPRLDSAARFLARAHAALQAPEPSLAGGRPAGADGFLLGAEWLLDNYYVVADQISEIRVDLPRRYYVELPKLTNGPLAGFPRIYGLARALVAYTDARIDQERISGFVAAYQEAVADTAGLTLGELWSVPIMLRLSLVETLAHLISAGRRLRAQAEAADDWADRLLAAADSGPDEPVAIPAELAGSPLAAEPAFAGRFYARVRDQGAALAPALAWLEARAAGDSAVEQRAAAVEPRSAAAGESSALDEMVRRDHRQQAALIASIGNAVTGMRRLSAIDWPSFVEGLSAAEARLREDPAEVYPLMDFATRDRYRHVVESLARRAERPETEVAAAVVRLAARTSGAEIRSGRAAHIGYYLIGEGRPALEAAIAYRPAPGLRAARLVQQHAIGAYLALVGGTTAAAIAGAVAWARRNGAAPGRQVATALAVALPASDLAVSLVTQVLTTILDPYALPKLDLQSGIPARARTFVVIPVLLTGAAQLAEMLEHLQVLYLANHDAHLHYALLSDFPDAATEVQRGEDRLLHEAVAGIAGLNRQYGGDDRFYLFHRRRRWNPREGVWMGWERKRGKLLEFNRLLRGAGGADFTVRGGDLGILAQVKYVITLDADTQLPAGTAARLIGTLAHPLNAAELDADRRVVHGYGILQPRVDVTATSTAASPFARIFAGHSGVDPYTTAISDIYQDLFHSGIYIGKGIYDVDAFEAATGGRFPENTLLSHDLLEGAYARAGLVSDIALFEDHPARYSVYARRQDRWIRGDWQIMSWLLPRVRDGSGARVRNPLPLLARWQIFDNLRRSLQPIAGLALFVAGWEVLPGPRSVWTALVLFGRAFPLVTGLLGGLPRKPAFTSWRRHFRYLLHESAINGAHTALLITLLPHQAYVHGRAIGRALLRMYVTHRRLLEWQTAYSSEQSMANTLPAYLRRMWPSLILDFGFWILDYGWRRMQARGPVIQNPKSKIQNLMMLAWGAAPVVAYWISQPTRSAHRPLRPDEQALLRRAARKTWRYFDEFVGPADGWLAPDNYQELPTGTLARRTSPTNLSLALLSVLAARHLGYLGLEGVATRLDQQIGAMERLERYRGHFFNWYETAAGTPLSPRYISTVDSTNLAAHLIVLKHGCLACADAPILEPHLLAGLADTARLLAEALPQGAEAEAEAIRAALTDFVAALDPPPTDLLGWIERVPDLAARATALAAQAMRLPAATPAGADLAYWARSLATQTAGYAADVETLLGWARHLARPILDFGFSILDYDEAIGAIGAIGGHEATPGSTKAKIQNPKSKIQNRVPSLASNLAWCARQLPHIRHARAAIRQADLAPEERAAALVWLDGLHDSLLAAWTASEQLIGRLRDLARRAEALSREMRFDFLYDPDRKLFTIGYNVVDGRRDLSHYDLLASESRLGSYLAIARGDVPAEHWFHLGRALAPVSSTQALVSWTGTMFEYLMPNLVMPVYPTTLLHQTSLAVVRRQRAYGRERGVPWGVSEAAYNLADTAHTYQYRAFGVPGLGLKRGLDADLVVAPYATMLALGVDPPAAVANLRHLAAEGLDGRYGYYEAIDYTPGRTVPAFGTETSPGGGVRTRTPAGRAGAIVYTYMVHHQGMSLLAIDNVLNADPFATAFMAEPSNQATDLLLQERVPRQAPQIQTAELADSTVRRSRQPLEPSPLGDDVIAFETAQTARPLAHLLSNGAYSVMLTNAGGGYSQWRLGEAPPIQVTRWRDDATCDAWGSFIYLREMRSGQVWSAGAAPVHNTAEYYGGQWLPDHGVIWRRDEGIESRLQVAVSPDEDVEVRRLTLTNRSARPREIEVTSYAEVVLAPASADLAHPAFQKLFVETEWVPPFGALLATRRPREAHEHPPWLMHVAAVEGDARGVAEYETDRARFLGRGHTPADPVAVAGGSLARLSPATALSGSVGAVLDPIVSLRYRVRVAPGASARITFATGIGATRDEALALAERYQDAAGGTRAIRVARSYARIALSQRDLTPAAAMRAVRLAGCVLFPAPALRPPREVLARNTGGHGQPTLWAYGISGDLPILLLVITEASELPLVDEVVRAHDYWRWLGLAVDLVILDEYSEGYAQPVHDELRVLLEHGPAASRLDKPGGVFLRRTDSMPEADQILLRTAARAVLLGRRGLLAQQLARVRDQGLGIRDQGLGIRGPAQMTVGQSSALDGRPHAVGQSSALDNRPPAPPREADSEFNTQHSTLDIPAPSPPEQDVKFNTQHSTLNIPAGLQFDNGRGGFSTDGREYVIYLSGEDWTPAPWTNVLANPEFGCLVSESAIGSSWWLNSRENRLTPWSNDPVSDPPSDVVYLRDEESGALWTPTPRPIREDAPYTVRHGQGYTVFVHTSHGLEQELTLFVPPDAPVRIIRLMLRNPGDAPRRLTVTNYVELVLGVIREPGARFIITGWDAPAAALTACNPYNNEFAGRLAFLAAAVAGRGAEPGPLSYTADRRTFLGRNGSLTAPTALRAGAAGLSGSSGAGLDPCAAIQVAVTVPAGAAVEVAFFLGETADADEMHALLDRLRGPGRQPTTQEQSPAPQTTGLDEVLAATRRNWDDLLGRVQVQTPDPALDLLLNRWLLYQALACRIWARSAFYQGGGAYGFRDQLQDVLALVHAAPQLTRAQVLRCAGRQFPEGDVQHWWHPPTGRGIRTRIADDPIWLPFVTALYIRATGDTGVLDELVPFLDAPVLQPGQEDSYSTPGVSQESATLYEHCVRGLVRGDTQGAHGLPLMGTGDWNDGMNRVGAEGRGESVWLAWFLAAALARFAPLAEARGDHARAAWCHAEYARLQGAVEQAGWDGAWYRRAYFDDGTPLGSHLNADCRIDSIAQSWAVLSGAAPPERARQAMAALADQLIRADDGLVLLLTPPFDQAPTNPGYIKGYVPGIRENGGQYTHAATWVGFAFAALGDTERAHGTFALLNPINHARDSEARDRYKVEPYVIVADIYSHPALTGHGGWTWYTGSAAWMYRLGLEAILGIQREGAALRFDPTIPAAWPGYTVVYRYEAATYTIRVDNAAGAGHGVAAVTLDGVPYPDARVPLDPAPGSHDIGVRLGR